MKIFKKKQFVATLALLAVSSSMMADGVVQVPLRSIYHEPAQTWESEALPIGNGYMGAMVYGGVYSDVIQTNEKTLWSGGPGEDVDYDGGHLRTPEENHTVLQQFRRMLQDYMTDFTATKSSYLNSKGKVVSYNYNIENKDSYITKLLGTKKHFGSYQTLSNIVLSDLDFPTIDKSSIWTDNDNEQNTGEAIEYLFDGNTTNKWFSEPKSHTFTMPVNITWNYNSAPTITGYDVTSANDVPGRDPKAWNLYASNDGVTYTLIDHQEGDFWAKARNTTKHFDFAETITGYTHFKLEITELMGGSSQRPQLAEFAFVTNDNTYTDYTRSLDIDNALMNISYTDRGINYKRELFMSYPDHVMVVHLTADKPFSRNIAIETPQKEKTITAEENTITMTGWPNAYATRNNPNYKDCLRYAQVVKVASTDGEVTNDGSTLTVKNATDIVILMSAATNYQQCMDNTFNYFSTEDPLEKANGFVAAACEKTYDQLKDRHVADYKSLYDRNKLNLNVTSAPEGDTKQILQTATSSTLKPEVERYMETLYYQYGRYLMISCSRPGSLPANLQGVWGESINNPWNADYHTNINIEMNYWPVETTNLSECHIPMVEFVQAQVPRGTITAQHYHCKEDGGTVRGWVANHEDNIWGNTGPAETGDYSLYPEGAIWMCQDIWEHYQFTQDKEFLSKYYDTMLQAALFWVDDLWTDERDNTLVVNPSYSPEHGPFSLGCTSSQGIIMEMFDATIKAAKVLGKENDSEVQEIVNAKSRLSMPKIGLAGEFQEWKDETQLDISGDGHHRHTNHLFWLHPGSQIIPGRSEEETKYCEAMKVTLNTRGDDGTGWSKAWKLNFWARLHEGDRSHKLLRSAMTYTTPSGGGGVYANLFDAHPPFQIDGNFGVTSGIAEMLLQSQGGYIELLPALPSDWAAGSFEGMMARGNFEVSASWANCYLTSLTITSKAGGTCTVKYPNIGKEDFTGKNVTVLSDDMISFETTKGETYHFDCVVGIQNTTMSENKSLSNKIYSLNGMQVGYNDKSLQPGIYVSNDKKFVVK